MPKLIKKHKSQAAFEQLIVVAWMLLIVGLVIFSFFYFGLLNMDKFLSDKMDMGNGLPVKDMRVDDNEIVFIFKSDLGKALYNFRVNVKECNDGEGAMSDPMTVPEGKLLKVTVDCPNAIAIGSKFKSEVDVTYETKTGGEMVEHSTTGDMFVEVSEPDGIGVVGLAVITISDCTELNESNRTYLLDKDLFDVEGKCFNITTHDNITLDLGGHKVVHKSMSHSTDCVGVWIRERKNITVMNGNISGFGTGIDIEDSSYGSIIGVKGTENWYGIDMHGACENNYVADNEMCGNIQQDLRCNTPGGNYGGGNIFTNYLVEGGAEALGYVLCPEVTGGCEFGGEGNISDPIIICNCTQLQSIGDNVTYLNNYYELGQDIDCSNTSNPAVEALYNSGAGFDSIGDNGNPFTGEFYGNSHTISNMYINGGDHTGLFASLDGATVRSVNVIDSNITGTAYVGALAGRIWNSTVKSSAVKNINLDCTGWSGGFVGFVGYYSKLEQVSVKNVNVSASEDHIGGVVGYLIQSNMTLFAAEDVNVTGNEMVGGALGVLSSSAEIRDGGSEGYVQGLSEVGGLVGHAEINSVVDNSFSRYMNVSGNNYVGGLVGKVSDSLINDSWTEYVNVSGNGYVGGFAGSILNCNITSASSEGNVASINQVGGFTGYLGYSNVNLSSSEGINVSGNYNVGGFAGQVFRSNITKCFSSFGVHGIDYVGGLVGTNSETNVYESFTENANVTGNDYVGGLIGYGDNSNVSSCYSGDVVVVGNENIGGLVGKAISINITHSSAEGILYAFRYVGGLVGYISTSFVSDAYAVANVSSSYNLDYNDGAGGLLGRSVFTNISHCHSHGNVTSFFAKAAGLVGSLEGGVIDYSYSTADVYSQVFLGGLVGSANNAKINNSYATGDIKKGSTDLGGLVGYIYNSHISSSYATGNVEVGSFSLGGLVGKFVNSDISNSYATGNINGRFNGLGGLVGFSENGRINNSYATGDVAGEKFVGGLVGVALSSSRIYNSYATGNLTFDSDSSGIVGNKMSLVMYNSYCTSDVYGGGEIFEPDSEAFYNISHNVYNSYEPYWDFISVWDNSSNMVDFPTLNMEIP